MSIVLLDIGVGDFLDIGVEDLLDIGPVGVVPMLFTSSVSDAQSSLSSVSVEVSLTSEFT